MNILLEQLPESVEIDGVIYDIDTDFRTCLRIILAYEDHELTEQEKMQIMLEMLYKELPDNLNMACEMAVKFLNCGEEESQNATCFDENIGRLYSFEYDAKYIYSAIKQSHGIDVEEIEYLHWWKFCYMFLDLKEECFFNRIIYLRKQKILGKLSKEEREIYAKLRNIIDLPEMYTENEQSMIDEFMRLLNEGDEVAKE